VFVFYIFINSDNQNRNSTSRISECIGLTPSQRLLAPDALHADSARAHRVPNGTCK